MARKLTERIAARAIRENQGWSKNRAQYLAVREEVLEAIEAGWPIKAVWETLFEEGKVSFSYSTMTSFVKKDAPAKPKPAAKANPGFTYNPSPTADELI